MGRFENSLALAKASWNVLREDKQLVLLPLFSSIAMLAVLATFVLPILVVAHDGSGEWTAKPVDWILGFVGYFAVTYVVVFFNAALVYAADCRLRGEAVTLG